MTLPQQRRIVMFLLAVLLFVIAGLTVGSMERTSTQIDQARNGKRGGLSVATTPASWTTILLALASPAIAALAIFATNQREAVRLEHERQIKLREERTKAYSAFFALARGARAASH